MTLVSVIVCTRNPRADYFARALDGLRGQTLAGASWELLVIDNASDEKLAGRIDLSWKPGARLVREEKLGLTPARLTGIREAAGELLVFVDDDNVLDGDFLEQAWRIARERPFLGAWSGQCRPDFETPPPDWTGRYWGNLVIREFTQDKWSNLPLLAATMPCGAGLCIRRQAARHYLFLHESGQRAIQLDRSGASLLSGGDNDMAACACDIGLGVGIVSDLRLTHLISPERLSEDYLTRLAEGIYFSAVVLAGLRGGGSELERVKWHEAPRAWLKAGPHRRIALAAIRGRRRGLQFVKGLG